MSAYFFDSSAIVKRYVAESGTPWVTIITDLAAGNKVYLCRITLVEVIAAITRRARASEISSDDAAKAITDFRHDFAQEYSLIEVNPALVQSAGDLAQVHALRA